VPSAFKEWSLPIDQLGEGAQYYKHDPARAKKLLAEAYIGVWDGALKNYSPNLGYDWGGRVTAAWLDR